MGAYYGTTGMWYKSGKFYELETTHVNFFLQNPRLLGFTKKEKEELCVENGLEPDAKSVPEGDDVREKILLEVLKRGAIRIRLYKSQTSVQCYDKDNKACFKQLKNCVVDGYGDAFWGAIVVMDTKGWQETVSDMGFGVSLEEFIESSKKSKNYKFISWAELTSKRGVFSELFRKGERK
jgi:hypothetical protein